jgi:hypothetical protein
MLKSDHHQHHLADDHRDDGRTGRRRPRSATSLSLFPGSIGAITSNSNMVVPRSIAARNEEMARAVRAAISNPRVPSCRLIECEFPALAALNKMGDGSSRSAMDVDDANLAAALTIARSFLLPVVPFFSPPKVWVIPSRSSSQRIQSALTKQWKRDAVHFLGNSNNNDTGGLPPVKSRDVCIFVAPSSSTDYDVAKRLTANGNVVVVVNGQAKVRVLFV